MQRRNEIVGDVLLNSRHYEPKYNIPRGNPRASGEYTEGCFLGENMKYIVETHVMSLTSEELNEKNLQVVGFTYDGDCRRFVYIFLEPSEGETSVPSGQPSSRFMFKNALIKLGVSPQLAADWIKVRQAKKAAQTETAFKIIEKQIKLGMEAYGVDADDIIRVAIDRNWQGINCAWLDNVDWSYYGIKVGKNDLPFGNDTKWQ